jgi:glucan phosphoethanolaminetransferase (alkaline phosphatase superfamily)
MKDSTGISLKLTPVKQAGISAAIALLGMGFCKLFLSGNGIEYAAAFTGIVFFVVVNCAMSIFHTEFVKYTLPSYGLFMLMVAILLLSAKFLSGISIWNLAEYRFMLTSVTIFYLVTSILVRVIRAIYDFAEEEDEMG